MISAQLEAGGLSVRSGTHLHPQYDSGLAELKTCPTAECFPIDFLQPASLEPLFAGVDAAVLILPQDKMIAAMASNLVTAAERAQLERLVLISFLHADSGLGGPMLNWHHEAEKVLRHSTVTTTCLRPNFYMQNFLSAFKPTRELNSGMISYVDARDVADAVVTVLSESGHEDATYSLTGPRAYSADEVVEILEGEVGPSVGLPGVSWEHVCFSSRRSGHSGEVQALCEMWQAASEGRFSTVTPDLERVIGRPGRSLEAFAKDHHGQCETVVSVAGAAPRCA